VPSLESVVSSHSEVRGRAPVKGEYWGWKNLSGDNKFTIFDTLCDTKIAI